MIILAFLVPRLSRPVERGGSGALGVGQRAGSKAPGPLGRLLSKPFGESDLVAAISAAIEGPRS